MMIRSLALATALCAQLALAGMPRMEGAGAQAEPQDEGSGSLRRGVFHFAVGPELFIGNADTFNTLSGEAGVSTRVGLMLSVSLGGRLTPAIALLGELSAAAAPNVASFPAVMWHAELMAVLDVSLSTLIFSAERASPVDFGFDLGIGVGGGQARTATLALPVLRPGLYARFVTSPGLSIGVSVRGLIPVWTQSPWTGSRASTSAGDPGNLGFAFQLERAF